MVNVKIIGMITAVLLFVVMPAFATDITDFSNPVTTSTNNLPNTSDVFWSENFKYSDLSVSESVVNQMWRINIDGGDTVTGNITIGYTLHRSNGTTDTYSYDMTGWPENSADIFLALNKGDEGLAYAIDGPGGHGNITSLQVLRVTSSPTIEINRMPSLEIIASGMATVVGYEVDIATDIWMFIKIIFMVGMIIVVPTLIILLIGWSIKKIVRMTGGR
jgi:hypothetical protein